MNSGYSIFKVKTNSFFLWHQLQALLIMWCATQWDMSFALQKSEVDCPIHPAPGSKPTQACKSVKSFQVQKVRLEI
jgi:hypothetical protein